jgi:adhesin/invasin
VVSANNASVAAGGSVTITAQLATSNGTPVATAGRTVTWSKTGSGGSFTAPASSTNTSGVATVAFTTGTAAGTGYTVTATDNASLTGTSGTITTVPGSASAATTTILATPQTLFADGASSATVSVQAKDAYGNNLTQSGGTVTLSTNRGAVSTVTNGQNGTYAATLTASTTPGQATISGTIGGSPIASTASVTFQAQPAKYLVSSSAASPVAGSAVTITAQLADANGNPVALAGKVVTWSAGGSGTLGAISSTTNASGLATVSFTTGPVAGAGYTVSATDDSAPPLGGTSAAFTTVAGAANHLHFSSASTDLAAGGTLALNVRVEDVNGNLVASDSGRSVSFGQSGGSGTVSGLGSTSTSGGTAAITITGTAAGPVTVTASSSGLASASASFSVVAGTATAMRFTSASNALASGSVRTLTIELRDPAGNLAAAISPVTFTKTSGAGTVSGLGSKASTAGVASATIVGQLAGPITITASSGALSAATTFSVVPGSADASKSTLSAAPTSIPANGSALSTITLHVKDAAGNALTQSAGPAALHTSAGSLSAVTDLHNGSYSAALTAGTTPGQAVVTGELGGEAIGGNVTIALEAQCVVPRVRGKTLRAAKDALGQAHCGVGTVKMVRSATVASGVVISQSPAAGRVLASGTKVKLTVSRGRRR